MCTQGVRLAAMPTTIRDRLTRLISELDDCASAAHAEWSRGGLATQVTVAVGAEEAFVEAKRLAEELRDSLGEDPDTPVPSEPEEGK